MGLNRSGFQSAIVQFHKARQKAAAQQILARITGRSVELLSFNEVASKLKATNRVDRGLQVINVDAIVGSVGRYTDFTHTFLPRMASDSDRWAMVKSAAGHISELPPIDVYQLGDSYFVLDGNHRVSIARQEGISFMDAHVTEVRTKVPFDPNDAPDELILKAEYASFLERTQIDRLRPDTDLTVSAPGKYASLENHIEVHRYFNETEQGIELSDDEAVICWHDEAYIPVVDAIREQGIMFYFPGRTETDFYVWLAKNQARLQHELGWRSTTASAVANLASQFDPGKKRTVAGVGKRILEAIVPDHLRAEKKRESWSQKKSLARYSGTLLQDVLVAVRGSEEEWPELAQALALARREDAHLHGIKIVSPEIYGSASVDETGGARFANECMLAGVKGEWVLEAGEPLEKLCQRSTLADLMVLSKSFLFTENGSEDVEKGLERLVRHNLTPFLVVPGEARPMDRLLLAYDDQSKAREALFLAAYFAECWRTSLIVVTVSESRREERDLTAHARSYLEMHELSAQFISERGRAGETILKVAAENESELIVMGSHADGLISRRILGSTIKHMVNESDIPLLICP